MFLKAEFRPPNPKLQALNLEVRLPNPKFKAPNLKHRALNLKLRLSLPLERVKISTPQVA
jgi:hypothetical protein